MGLKILLLEDNQQDINLVSHEIKKQLPDAELVVVKYIREARKLLENHVVFDIALFDIKLPDGSGLDLLIEMRSLHNLVPILMFTSESSEEIATQALKAGANDYMAKKPGYYKAIPEQIEFTLKEIKNNSIDINVLYIEHIQADIDLTKHYLGQFSPHIKIHTAPKGDVALELLPKNNSLESAYDLVLLDYKLPGLNALEIIKIIRQERKLFIPIIVVTGQGNETVAIEALKIGADDYIVKRDNYLLKLPSIIMNSFKKKELERQQYLLKQSETKFRLLADYASDWEYWVNPQHEYLYNSPVCETVTGYKHESFVENKNLLLEMTLANYKELVKEHFSLEQFGMCSPLEFKIKTLNGEEKWISHYCSAVYDDNQNYLGQRGVNRDISERKKYEEGLLKMTKAIDNTSDTVFMTDAEGTITFINKSFTLMYGYTAEEIIGKVTPRILKSGVQNLETYKKYWSTLLQRKNVREFQFVNKTKSGKLINIEASADPIISESGNIRGFVGIHRDISERKRGEIVQNIILNIANISQQDASLNELLEVVQSELGRVVDTQNFFIALFNEENDTINLSFFRDEKGEIKDFPTDKTLTSLVIKNGESLILSEKDINELVHKKEIKIVGVKSKTWLGVPLKNKDKVIGAFVVQSYTDENAYTEKDKEILEIISHQISISIERKRNEEALLNALDKAKESDRLKSAFLSNMSHEIRTPMNGILGFSELLKSPGLSIEKQQKFIDIIEKSGKRMLITLNDIVDISRIESGQMTMHISAINIDEILNELFTFFKSETKNKGIELIYNKLNIPQIILNSDEHKFTSVLTNLIKNAIKFTNTGSIEIGYNLKDNNIEFYVKDSGIGIPAERLPFIFDRFVQADIEDKLAHQGSGLGLAIAKSYAEMIEGNLSVTSVEGEGTQFYFTLPNK